MMTPKPKIQYVGQFYVYGSEAQKVEVQPKKPKTTLPKLRLKRPQKIYIDPMALCGLASACVILAMMVFGTFQLTQCMKEYNRMSAYLTQLKRENATLTTTYHEGFNEDEVRELASAYGMVTAEEAEQYTVFVSVPKAEQKQTAWDEFVWFFTGLFAGAKE